ncbi:MAG: DNA-directed DNA polymerase II small subunit, partial [Methanobacteriota archaeon]
ETELAKRVVHHILGKGYQVTPQLLDKLLKTKNPVETCSQLLENTGPEDILLVELPTEKKEKKSIETPEEEAPPIHIIQDVTTNSTCTGCYEDFLHLFQDRYKQLADILSVRPGNPPTQISRLPSQGEAYLIGMVTDKRVSKGRDEPITFLTLEDPTGQVDVLLPPTIPENHVAQIVLDEVIGVRVEHRNNIPIAREVFFPDLPARNRHPRTEKDVGVLMLSDLHVGSIKFLEEEFNRMLDWLNMENGDKKQREQAMTVKYVVICGDLVDGVGVYPEQEEELKIDDIYQQYEKAASLLSKIRRDIRIVVAPGNHDAVRGAEPQPAIPPEVAQPLYDLPNLTMVGNPATLELHGIRFLLYHGQSLGDLVETIPGQSLDKPSETMKIQLRKRHLAPTYGRHTVLAPERKDYHVIHQVPDVFHSGHLHINSYSTYRGVVIVNSGTWQSQTSYQKKRNITPTPCRAPLLNLKTMKITELNFSSQGS